MNLLRGVRSLFCVLLVGLWFMLSSLPLRLVVLPGAWLFPRQRFRLVSVYMKTVSRGILALLTLGGAHFRREGTIPTGEPVLIVANHQSLVDILQIGLVSRPRVPAYVTRARYARFVPLVSACIRLLGCPVIDPKRDPRGAVDTIREGVRRLPHGILIFPEGHRSTDGEVRPFRSGGIAAVLLERRAPVYLALNDGTWRVRRFVDLLFRVHLIDATTRVMGPIAPPPDPSEVPAFVDALRATLVSALAADRSTRNVS